MSTAPKAFTVRYYLERLEGYSPPLARAAVAVAERRWAWPTAWCGRTSATGWPSWPGYERA